MEIGFNAVFITAVLQIIAIDILLGGDNAIVIALACRRLPPKQRRLGIFWGVFGAVALRLILIFFALQLLSVPGLKIIGGLLLLWIGIKLIQPDGDHHTEATVAGSTRLISAIKTIIIADAVMSLDNVIAVSAAAQGHFGLAVFGILISVPIIIWGSHFVLRLFDRFPVIILLGGVLLGWVGGGMLVGDVVLQPFTTDWPNDLQTYGKYFAAMVGALLVLVIGKWIARRKTPASKAS
ncbi:MAG: TerC family protein [Burkholderiales bacterium]|nr:TerC family protein [Burkholderiales bacterium]